MLGNRTRKLRRFLARLDDVVLEPGIFGFKRVLRNFVRERVAVDEQMFETLFNAATGLTAEKIRQLNRAFVRRIVVALFNRARAGRG